MKKKNINSIKKIFKVLNLENYQTIQYYPTNFSYLALIKEFENLIKSDQMIEYEQYGDFFYGTSKDELSNNASIHIDMY